MSSLLHWGKRLFARGKIAPGKKRPPRSWRPSLEHLEDRTVPSIGHGMWVFNGVDGPSVLDEDPDASLLLGFSQGHQVTEVYLSIARNPVSDARLPNFLRHLKDGGLRVEALISDTQNDQARILGRIDSVIGYNAGRAANEGFDGVHLDIEPWVGTGSDFSWVGGLIDTYQAAGARLGGTGLTLAADMSGSKIISAGMADADAQALLDAATRLVLMEYEVPEARVADQVDRFLARVDLSSASFQVATRVNDFGSEQGDVLGRLDQRYDQAPGYAGWASYDYARWFAASAGALALGEAPLDAQVYLSFNGQGDYVEVPDHDDFSVSTTGALTVSAWIRPDTLNFPRHEGSTDQYVHWLGKGGPGEQEWVFRMYDLDDAPARPNRISFYVFNPEGGQGVGSYYQPGRDGNPPLTPGEWIHVVGSADGERTSITVNNVRAPLRDADVYAGLITPQHGSAPLRMGTRDFGSFFQGGITQVRVWNRALDIQEVSDLYAGGLNPRADQVPQDGLVAEYPLNQDTGNVARDTTGAHDGTIFGATWRT